MSPPSDAVGMFDRAAESYDAVGVPFFGPIAEGLVEELAPLPGERALDVGCGRGAVLGRVARRVGPAGRAVGIDLAPGMVRRTAADLADLPWVEVRLDDARAPALSPASFDLVASSLVLFFLDDPVCALRGWRDLVVPGGRVGVTTFAEEDPRWRALDEVFLPYLPPEHPFAGDPDPAADPFASDAGVEALLREAGLLEIRTVRRTVEVRLRDLDHLVAFSWSHGGRALWEAVPVGERDAVRARLGDRATELGLGSGGFAFSEVVRHTLGRRPGPERRLD